MGLGPRIDSSADFGHPQSDAVVREHREGERELRSVERTSGLADHDGIEATIATGHIGKQPWASVCQGCPPIPLHQPGRARDLWRFWGARFYLLVEHLHEGKQNVNVGCGDRYLFGFVVFRTFNGFG